MLQVTIPNPDAAKIGFDYGNSAPEDSITPSKDIGFNYGASIPEDSMKTPQQPISGLASAARGAVGAATLGFGESMPINSSAIGMIGGLGARAYSAMTGQDLFPDQSIEQTVGEGQKLAQTQGEQAQEQHPLAYMAGGLPAGVAAAEGLAMQAPKVFGAASPQASLVPRLVQNAKAGLALGAVQGGLSTPGDVIDRLGGAALGGAIGAPMGAAGGEVGRAIGKGINYARGVSNEIPAANEAERGFINQNYGNDQLLANIPEAQANMYNASKRGITLTPGEALNNESMIAQQGTLSRKPGGLDMAQALRESRQNVQLPNALENEIGKISSVASPDEAGQSLIQGAQDLESQVRKDLSAKAAPYYESAYTQAISKNDPVLENERIKDYLKMVRKDFPEYKDLPNNSIQVLDEVKKLMDGDISTAMSGASPDRNAARLIGRAKSTLLNTMDSASDAYKQARKIYAEGAPEIDDIIKGRIGALSKVKDVSAYNAPKQLMSGSIAQTQDVANRLPEQSKDAAAAIIQSEVNNLRGENSSTIQKKIFNTPKQQQQFKAMLGDKYDSFAQLMDIMERVNKGQSAMQGSPTAPLQEQSAKMDDLLQLGRQAKDDKAGFAKAIVSKLFGSTPEARTMAENKQYADLGKILLTPKGLDLLETIAELKPSVEQARKLLGLSQTAGIVGATTSGTQKTKGALKVKYDSTNQ